MSDAMGAERDPYVPLGTLTAAREASQQNPYTSATPLDQILCALQIWRNMDHADSIKLSRHDVITIIEGVKALRLAAADQRPAGATAVEQGS